MRSASAAYLAELALLVKTPCALVEFDVDQELFNADFEDGGLESFTSFNSPNTFENSTAEAFSGTKSLKIEESGASFAGGRRNFSALSGRSYVVSCWAQRTIGTGQTDTHLLVSGDVTEFAVTSVTPIIFSEWEFIQLISTEYSSNGTVTVELAAQNGDQIFFDDVIVTELGKLDRRYSSNTFVGITANDKKLLMGMFMGLVNIDLINGHADHGLTKIGILDKDLDFSGVMRDDDMENRKVIVKIGFDSLADTDFVTLPAVKTKRIELDSTNLIYTLIAKDIRTKLQDKIFRFKQRTTLTAAYTAGDANLTVSSTSEFVDKANTIPSEYNWFDMGVKVDGQIFRYGAVTATTFTSLVKGFRITGTEDVNHDSFAEVTQVFLFNGTAGVFNARIIKNFLHLLFTTLDGQGHPFYDLTRFDLGFAGMGLSMDEDEIDVLGIENTATKVEYNSILNLSIGIGRMAIGDKPVSALPFFEKQIFRPLGIFPFWNNDSRITLGTFDHLDKIVGFSASQTIDNDDIISGTLKIENEELINHIEVRTNIKIGENRIQTSRKYELDASISAYNGRTNKVFVIEHDLWDESTGQDDDYIANNYLRRWFYFWGNVPGRFKIRTRATSSWRAEPGDVVGITYSKFPELNGSSPAVRSWTNKSALITGQSVEWAGNNKNFILEGITWELFDRVSSFTTDTTILEAAITRTAMTFQTSANNTATLQAEDAYTDVSPQVSAQAFKISIQCTEPDSVPEFHHLYNLGVHVQSPTGTDVFTSSWVQAVRYFTASPDVYIYEFFFVIPGGTINVDRVKIDPFSLRTTANGTVPAAETPTLEFVELTMSTLNKAITRVTP